jgi:hypothetical protein
VECFHLPGMNGRVAVVDSTDAFLGKSLSGFDLVIVSDREKAVERNCVTSRSIREDCAWNAFH